MKHRLYAMLASSSMFAIASTMSAHAADATASEQQSAQAEADQQQIEEIVITARRKAENLQIVPETVDVVTSQALQNYNLLQFTDIADIVPGLTLNKAPGTGFAESGSMRGVTYDETQAVPPTVTYYLNDVPVDAGFLFQSLYDVGQIEVLRGPTGTLRGEISPSGSITVTSRAPDLERFGGYVSGTVGNLDDTNIQGAVNVPIVQDKFAIRVAVLRNDDSLNGVHSVFNAASPNERNEAARVSAKFAPNDDLTALVTYQLMDNHSLVYGGEITGPGAPGGMIPNPYTGVGTVPAPPANYNGPPIRSNQLLTNDPVPSRTGQRLNDIEAKVDWTIHGQQLSYVGGYYETQYHAEASNNGSNLIPNWPGDPTYQQSYQKQLTQELRLSSVNPLWDRLDYTVGAFYKHVYGTGFDNTGPTYLNGAYGPPVGTPILAPPNETYALGTVVAFPGNSDEYASYGSLTFHFDKKTEITAGIRSSDYQQYGTTTVSFTPAAIALELPAGICNAIGGAFGKTYSTVCNYPIKEPSDAIPGNGIFHPVIYNVELSHRFTDVLMAYFRTASSYRPGNVQVGPSITGATVPALQPYLYPKPETSKSYEGGIKSEWFDKRVLFDIDYYHQSFNGFFTDVLPFYYLKTSIVPGVVPAVSTATLIVANAPAVVNGIEAHAVAKLMPELTITPSFSWADGHLANATVPCNPPVAGVPTVAYFQALGQLIYTCKSSQSTSTAPRWNLTLQAEYARHINESINGFIRGLLYYYPSNPNTSVFYTVPAYATLNLFVGVVHPDRQWEVDVYGKNITGDKTITELGQPVAPNPYFGSSGYVSIAHTPRREFGLTLRYAFGSR